MAPRDRPFGRESGAGRGRGRGGTERTHAPGHSQGRGALQNRAGPSRLRQDVDPMALLLSPSRGVDAPTDATGTSIKYVVRIGSFI